MGHNSTEEWTPEELYGYDPVLALAYAGAAVFLTLAAVMLFSNLRFPPHRFMHVLVFAALGEVAGFGLRVLSVKHTTMLTYVATTLFLLLMPNFIALANYIAAGRLMAFSNLNVGCLRPTWIAKIFFISDLLSFGVQGLGGGMLANTDSQRSQDLGKLIIITGLVLQSLALFLFLFVAVTVHRRPRYKLRGVPDAELMFVGLYVTTALLFVRSIFRLAEYAGGRDSYLKTHEWAFYVFDSLAVAGAFVVYALPAVHFGRCLNGIAAELKGALPLHIHHSNPAPPPPGDPPAALGGRSGPYAVPTAVGVYAPGKPRVGSTVPPVAS